MRYSLIAATALASQAIAKPVLQPANTVKSTGIQERELEKRVSIISQSSIASLITSRISVRSATSVAVSGALAHSLPMSESLSTIPQ